MNKLGPMNKLEKGDQFDVEALRKQVSDIEARGGAGQEKPSDPTEINPYARQIAEQFRDGTNSPVIIIGQLRLLEFLALFAIALIVHYFWPGDGNDSTLMRTGMAAIASALTVIGLQLADTYTIPALRAKLRLMPRIVAAWTIALLLTVGLFALIGGTTWAMVDAYIPWFAAGALFLAAERFLVAYGIRNWARNGIMERRAVIVGGGEPAKDLIRILEQQADNDIRICGIFDDRGEKRSPIMVAGYPKLGTVAELVEFVRLTRIDMLIIALPLSAEARIYDLLKKLWVLPVDRCRCSIFSKNRSATGIPSPSAASTSSSLWSRSHCSGR
jgi:FlaA1/EpsC-like NDP-sugar epimerase